MAAALRPREAGRAARLFVLLADPDIAPGVRQMHGEELLALLLTALERTGADPDLLDRLRQMLDR